VTRAGSETVFVTNDKKRYSIQYYQVVGSKNELRTFLAAQQNIHAISETTLNGISAYHFTVDGIYGEGFALLSGNKLYYLLGRGVADSALGTSFALK
jgi:hypothetical protein